MLKAICLSYVCVVCVIVRSLSDLCESYRVLRNCARSCVICLEVVGRTKSRRPSFLRLLKDLMDWGTVPILCATYKIGTLCAFCALRDRGTRARAIVSHDGFKIK